MVDLYGGHIIPGVGYLTYAFWWSLTTTLRFIQSVENNKPFKSTVAMPAIFLPANLVPWYISHPAFESGFRFVCSLVGVIFHPIDALGDYKKALAGETNLTLDDINHADHHVVVLDRWEMIYRVEHHFVLYFAFAMGSFVELLIHCGVPFPRQLDRAMLIMVFGFEAFILSNHLSGRVPGSIDVAFHVHLAYAVYGTLLFCILEAYNQHEVLFSYGRCVFTALIGSWFLQIGIALYLPFESLAFLKWPTAHNLSDTLLPLVTYYFCIHFLIIFVFMFVELWLVRLILGCRKSEASFKHAQNDSARNCERFYDSDGLVA